MNQVSTYPRQILMTADTVGGVWNYALQLARSLGRSGIGVVLATMGSALNASQEDQVTALPNVVLCESTFKLEWMDDPWTDLAEAADWLLDLEASNRPDLVHLNGYVHAALPWRAPTLVVGHSCVLSWWRAVKKETPPACWERYHETVAAGLRNAHLVVAPSHAMLTALDENYGPLANTRVIRNGLELRHLKETKEPIVLAAGRLWDEAKNISALDAIASSVPWPIYIAGEENTETRNPHRHAHLHKLGHLSSGALQSWFTRASIYALPARYEPFGLSILEAALAGCALVLGDIPSLRELWNGAADFVPPDSPSALRDALLDLIANPAKMRRQGAQAREAASVYTARRMADGYLKAYQDCIAIARAVRPASSAIIPAIPIEHTLPEGRPAFRKDANVSWL